jgi:hypothetical protein
MKTALVALDKHAGSDPPGLDANFRTVEEPLDPSRFRHRFRIPW